MLFSNCKLGKNVRVFKNSKYYDGFVYSYLSERINGKSEWGILFDNKKIFSSGCKILDLVSLHRAIELFQIGADCDVFDEIVAKEEKQLQQKSKPVVINVPPKIEYVDRIKVVPDEKALRLQQLKADTDKLYALESLREKLEHEKEEQLKKTENRLKKTFNTVHESHQRKCTELNEKIVSLEKQLKSLMEKHNQDIRNLQVNKQIEINKIKEELRRTSETTKSSNSNIIDKTSNISSNSNNIHLNSNIIALDALSEELKLNIWKDHILALLRSGKTSKKEDIRLVRDNLDQSDDVQSKHYPIKATIDALITKNSVLQLWYV